MSLSGLQPDHTRRTPGAAVDNFRRRPRRVSELCRAQKNANASTWPLSLTLKTASLACCAGGEVHKVDSGLCAGLERVAPCLSLHADLGLGLGGLVLRHDLLGLGSHAEHSDLLKSPKEPCENFTSPRSLRHTTNPLLGLYV